MICALCQQHILDGYISVGLPYHVPCYYSLNWLAVPVPLITMEEFELRKTLIGGDAKIKFPVRLFEDARDYVLD